MSLHCHGVLGGERRARQVRIPVRCCVPLVAGLVFGMAGALASAAASPVRQGLAGVGSIGASIERGGVAPLVLCYLGMR